MAETFRDDFTNSDGTALQTHDANWTKSWSCTADSLIASNRARGATGAANIGYYYNGFTPGSADYTVGTILRTHSLINNTGMGVVGRSNAGASPTQYWARAFGVSAGTLLRVQLIKFVAGAASVLDVAHDEAFSAGADKTLELVMVSDQISVTLDGVTIIGPATDSSISSVGVVGVRSLQSGGMSNTTGVHLDDIYVIEGGGGGGSTQPPRTMHYFRMMR